MRRLLQYMRPQAGLLVGVMAAILATTAIELAPPWLIRYAVDGLIVDGQAGAMVWVAGLLLLVSLLQGSIDFVRLYAMAHTGQRIVFGIRNAVFEHLSQLSFSFYDQARTGDLMSRITADVDVLSEFFGRAAVIILTNLLAWNWRLGLLYLALLPLLGHGMWVYSERVRPAMGLVRRRLAGLTAVLQESLALLEANLQTTRITSLWMPYVHVLTGASMGLVLWFGGLAAMQETISLGTLIAFTVYINMLLRPIRQTGMMLNVLLRSAAAAERVFEVLDIQPEVRDAPDARPLPPVAGHVRFEGVSFAYDGHNEVLREVDLDVAPGEMVALVGPCWPTRGSWCWTRPRPTWMRIRRP